MKMHPSEIFVIILIVAFVGFMIGKAIYNHKKGIKGCNCSSGKGKALVAAYHADKKREEKCCCCDKDSK